MRRFRYPFARKPDIPFEENGELWGGAVCAEDLERLGHQARPIDDCSSATSDCGVGMPARIRLPARCREFAPVNWSIWIPDDHGAHDDGPGLRQTALEQVLAAVVDSEERPREIEIRVAAGA